MTIPSERYRAVKNAREFLRDLLDPKKTPKVPKSIRRQAYWVLKHFPADYEMDIVAEKAEDLFKNEEKAFAEAVRTTLNKTAKKVTKKGTKPKKPSL